MAVASTARYERRPFIHATLDESAVSVANSYKAVPMYEYEDPKIKIIEEHNQRIRTLGKSF